MGPWESGELKLALSFHSDKKTYLFGPRGGRWELRKHNLVILLSANLYTLAGEG